MTLTKDELDEITIKKVRTLTVTGLSQELDIAIYKRLVNLKEQGIETTKNKYLLKIIELGLKEDLK
jgi:hypothetical protein